MFLECLRGGESLSLLVTATLSWEILYILKSDINKIEMVQRRAVRYVTNRLHNTSSVGDMLQHLNLKIMSLNCDAKKEEKKGKKSTIRK
jgi:hypothetical protein